MAIDFAIFPCSLIKYQLALKSDIFVRLIDFVASELTHKSFYVKITNRVKTPVNFYRMFYFKYDLKYEISKFKHKIVTVGFNQICLHIFHVHLESLNSQDEYNSRRV
jgi:hypothetical protein